MDATPFRTTSWYVSAMEGLVAAVQELSHARDLNAVTAVIRDAARNLTGADGATFVLRDGDQCYYAEENAIAPLWKGKRFPMSACVSGWVMLNAQSAVIEDIYNDPRVPVEAYRPTFVKSLAMVPIRRASPIGAIGNYWSSQRVPSAEELAILQALADTTSVALENADLYMRLHAMVVALQEQQARISKQHASLSVFTRALAHDLREPVRTLMSFSELLRDGVGDGAKQDTYLRFIGESASRMGKLIDSVSQYTRLDAPEVIERTSCNLAEIIDEVRQNLAFIIEDRRATVMHGPLPDLIAHPVHLRQLFQNLVANAISHNAPGITVTIGHSVADGHGIFTVADDGIGIPQDELEHVFRPFHRLVHNNESSGLGLAICQRIVATYGGEIGCVPSKGATFRFTLPEAEQPTLPGGDDEGTSSPIANVLIVDDREADLELTELALFTRPKLRCNLLSVRDGREAYRLLTAPESVVDLILLDINMPDVDGFRLLEQIRGDDDLHDMNVIMCSGSDYEPDQKRSFELGAVGYLLKPPRLANFRDILSGLPGLRLVDEEAGMALVRGNPRQG
ncbi:hybrid sensor histidine kinase/response regulator [Novosphingobium sp. BL-8A]|uniref:ATP-binding protein n=1 Tax=Novosphingobium sp. BL-8A TaxID=3127639 RepID=UPI003757F1EB